jgi:hypothetical protein
MTGSRVTRLFLDGERRIRIFGSNPRGPEELVGLFAGMARPSTPAGVAALSRGDRIECGVDGVGTLKVSIGQPA